MALMLEQKKEVKGYFGFLSKNVDQYVKKKPAFPDTIRTCQGIFSND